MALFAALLELDRVVFERVNDNGGYVGGAFELACRLWLTAAAAAGLSAAEISARASAMLSADNASASVVKELLEEVAKQGTATVKRTSGDWTTSKLVGW